MNLTATNHSDSTAITDGERAFLSMVADLDLVDQWNQRALAWLNEIERLRSHGHRISVGGPS